MTETKLERDLRASSVR